MAKSILIVEDEKNVALVLKDIFCLEGYDTEVAFTGKEAKCILQKKGFDLVTLDIEIPQVSGIEILKFAKKKYPGMKTVILTGFLDEYKGQCKRIGCDALLNKPFSINTIVEVVKNTLKGSVSNKDEVAGLINNPKILGKAKLLFIEPNEIMYSSKSLYFKDESRSGGRYGLEVAFTEKEVMNALDSYRPDIVLSNIMMYRLYEFGDKFARSSNPPKDVILYGLSGSMIPGKAKNFSFLDGFFDPITLAVEPQEMDKLGRIVRSTAIAHGLYVEI